MGCAAGYSFCPLEPDLRPHGANVIRPIEGQMPAHAGPRWVWLLGSPRDLPPGGGRQPFTHESCIWLGSRPEPGATRATRRRRPRQAGAVRRSRPARNTKRLPELARWRRPDLSRFVSRRSVSMCSGSSPSGRHDRRQTTKWSRLCPCRALGRQRSTTETPWRPWVSPVVVCIQHVGSGSTLPNPRRS